MSTRAPRSICRTVGSTEPLAGGTFGAEHCSSFEKAMPTFAVGVGAFGESFADCRSRFGEMLSVAGATAYQPGDGTNVADYLIAAGNLGADIRVLYCLACEGRFSHLVRFETLQPGGMAGLSRLIAGCFEAVPCNALGIVMVAEAEGLVGAALRRSPTERIDGGGFFAHPGLRTRLTFTTERAFTRSVVLAAGVATRDSGGPAHARGQLRPIGPNHAGHFHAAAFRFRPVRKGVIDLGETVTGLFESEQLLGVLHLLYDDRAISRRPRKRIRQGCLLDRAHRRRRGAGGLTRSCASLNHAYVAADRRPHYRTDPVAARARRVHQLQDLRLSRHHRRRFDHARCSGHRGADYRRGTSAGRAGGSLRGRRRRGSDNGRPSHQIQHQRPVVRHPGHDGSVLREPAHHG